MPSDERRGLRLIALTAGAVNMVWAGKYAFDKPYFVAVALDAFIVLTLMQAAVVGFGYVGYRVVEHIWDKQSQGRGDPSVMAWVVGVAVWVACAGGAVWLLMQVPAFREAMDVIEVMKGDE